LAASRIIKIATSITGYAISIRVIVDDLGPKPTAKWKPVQD
jgi:hypothetical protein